MGSVTFRGSESVSQPSKVVVLFTRISKIQGIHLIPKSTPRNSPPCSFHPPAHPCLAGALQPPLPSLDSTEVLLPSPLPRTLLCPAHRGRSLPLWVPAPLPSCLTDLDQLRLRFSNGAQQGALSTHTQRCPSPGRGLVEAGILLSCKRFTSRYLSSNSVLKEGMFPF